jgi:hypothetical protein
VVLNVDTAGDREGVIMGELDIVIEPSGQDGRRGPVAAERLDELCAGLAEDLRTVRGIQVDRRAVPEVAARPPSAAAADGPAGPPARGPAVVPGGTKSAMAWELGMLVVGGVFSASTMGAIASIAVAYADRVRARSIRLRRGDDEIVVTGTDDPALVAELARQLFTDRPAVGPNAGPAVGPTDGAAGG